MASPRPLPKTLQDMRENELDKPCSDLDLACLACEFTEWERVAPHLGISEAEADEVRHDSKSYWHQKRDVLRKWKHKQGSGATYRKNACSMNPSVFMWLLNKGIVVTMVQQTLYLQREFGVVTGHTVQQTANTRHPVQLQGGQ